ncbi:hypothetical protein J7E88_01545 [Streptomyces sp. ISL-10]|uniref:hypothetical protein n=1 Tax=Streptomyces sp. ISL-10 TaxID=2819172 RepID=UPI001BEC6F33|nr:hypothetical protein [Streptomyces sp. ISL-10]MBT2364049.1 hypothetical protein [Streptomyces sp. ISL-10]
MSRSSSHTRIQFGSVSVFTPRSVATDLIVASGRDRYNYNATEAICRWARTAPWWSITAGNWITVAVWVRVPRTVLPLTATARWAGRFGGGSGGAGGGVLA